jgi:iron complex transport system permease protein
VSVLSLLTGALLFSSALSLSLGAVAVPPEHMVAVALEAVGLETPWSPSESEVVVLASVRAPRVLLGVAVGAALAVAGAALQGLFRNPLADPTLIGVSSGAALAAVAVTVLGAPLVAGTGLSGAFLLSVAAFLGGLATVVVVYRVATVGGRTSVATMLLAGVAVNAVAAAGTGAFVFASDDQQLRDFTFWTLGSLGGATWGGLVGSIPLLLLGLAPALFLARPLNALLLGQAEARHLGVDVDRVKLLVVASAAVTVGAAVALAGIIGFVGLVTPHLVRLLFGPDHRLVLPGSALLGATLLVLADLVSRTVVAPAELPVGVVTALLGGPFFLWLILRDRREAGLEGLA